MNIYKSRQNYNIYIKKNKLFIILILTFILFIQFSFVNGALAYVQIEPFEPQHIEEGAIPNRGPFRDPEPMEFRCYLEAGHKYHIFLVGEWVTNSSDATDYDIEVRNPNNVVVSINTESAGLPEQVANDEKHQFFVPSQTGDYRFLIYNDPEDSPIGSADAADFLIIEHIEMNSVYTKKLFGKPRVGADYPDGYKIAYEFNTSEPQFLLNIKVPDPEPAEGITGLDMYEARVYPMANPEVDNGYSIQNVGVPFGERLYKDGVSGAYGGYNTEIEGFRFSDMRISCESAGVDMRKVIQMQETNSTEQGQNIFYYLVLLAEYFEGEIEFYIKTDYRPVNLTLLDPPEVGYTNETTLIKVESESAAEVESMWIEYTTDNWKHTESINLIDKDDYWLAVLPSFNLHDDVEYRIHAVDEIDNRGLIEGSFTVMNKVEIDFGLSGSVIQGGQTVKITGAATKPSINLKLNLEHGGNTESINVQTDGDGIFTYDYKPKKIGEYDVTLTYAGDEDYHSASSREKSFRVDKRKLELSCEIKTNPIKIHRPMTIKGKIIPSVSGLEVETIFVSPETSFTETKTTDRNGAFSITITPEVLGTWDMLPQLKVSELYDASQGSMQSFTVEKLSPVDIVKYQALKFTEPPLVYVAIGLGVVVIVAVLQKTGLIDKLRNREGSEEEDEQEEAGTVTSYKRRSDR
jgi:hypothetical protein